MKQNHFIKQIHVDLAFIQNLAVKVKMGCNVLPKTSQKRRLQITHKY